MDDIWYLAGDKSLDFNWYSKRIILSGIIFFHILGIYTTTEIFYMNDQSPERFASTEFLNRRLQDSFLISKKAADISNLSRLYSSVRYSGYQRHKN
jgi:ubiquinone biosynthesis protein COQ9